MRCSAERIVQSAVCFKRRYDICHIDAYSGEAAFFVLLSAVPMAMLATMFTGYLLPADFAQQWAEIAGELPQFIKNILGQITVSTGIPLVSVTGFFLLWTATKGIRSISDGLNAIFDSGGYSIFQLGLRSVLYTLALFTVCFASLGGIVFSYPLERALSKLLGGAKGLTEVINLPNAILFAAFTLMFALAYKGLAKSGISFKNQLVGAAVAASGWIGYSIGYSVYIKHFSRYSALYGGFGAVMLFMLWLYMCMNILLCGALINKMRAERKKCD